MVLSLRSPQVLFGLLGVPIFWFHGYFMVNQLYVTRFENVLNGAAIGLHAIELCLGAFQALLPQFLPSQSRIDKASCIIRIVVIGALNVVAFTLTLAVSAKLLPEK